MIRNVTWISESDLPCSPTANVFLCTPTFTIPAQLIEVFTNSCPGEYAYQFTYEDSDLPTDYLDDYGPLSDDDIDDVLCEDCYTRWVQELVNKAFELIISRGPTDIGNDLIIPSGGPLIVTGGDGILTQLFGTNEVKIHVELSADADNQLSVGTDGNPYVGPSLFSSDGWYSISDSWTFASATTVNVPAGALLRYAKGDKVKFDNAFTKYFYVIDVADTLLTVLAGDTYGVSNSFISNIFLSKTLTPVGFPSSFAFLTTYVGFSVLPVQIRRYSVLGRRAIIDVTTTTPGTSNGITYTMTSPLMAEVGGPGFISGGNQGYDNAIYQKNILAEISAGGTIIGLFPEGAAVDWTAAGDKSANFNLEFYF